jgi:Spy/CpxP family protein refolding chaperone
LLVALGLSLLAPSAPVLGQESGPASRKIHAPRQHTGPKIDDQVRVLAKNLNLGEAQQSAVKKILEQRQQQTQHIRLDPSLSGSARIDQFRALQDITVERIRAVLTEEQKKSYNPLLARKRQQPPQRSVEDWLKVTTPH